MSEHNDDSFRKKSLKQKIGTVLLLILFIAVVLSFIFGTYLFGMAGIFKLLGIQYTSVWSLIIFVVSFFIISSIVELFIKPISELITENITEKFTTLLIQFNFQSLSNGLSMRTDNQRPREPIRDISNRSNMSSITLTLKTGIIVAILLTLLEMAFEEIKNKSES